MQQHGHPTIGRADVGVANVQQASVDLPHGAQDGVMVRGFDHLALHVNQRRTARAASCLRLAQGPERRPQLLREQLRLFPGSEVPAPGGLVVVHEGRVTDLDPAARGLEDLAGEGAERDREGDGGGVWPAAAAWARLLSQYERAAETPLPVSR